MVFLQLKDPLELFAKRKEFFLGFGFLSHRDMTSAVESDVKPQTFLPLRLSCFIVSSLVMMAIRSFYSRGSILSISFPSYIDSAFFAEKVTIFPLQNVNKVSQKRIYDMIKHNSLYSKSCIMSTTPKL